MLLILMYHQIANPVQKFGIQEFSQHLEYLKHNFHICLPGSNPLPRELSICLTFDDAYYDFYHYIYPLLQTLQLPAVLGIPTAYINETSTISPEKRLSVVYPQALESQEALALDPLCTWEEIQEMVNSGLVYPASHSDTHADLTKPSVNLEREIKTSQQILQQKLNHRINTFIYPFGNMNAKVHKFVRANYQFALRIGSAINYNWFGRNGMLYRIDADHLWPQNLPLDKHLLRKLKWKNFINRIRRK